MKTILSILAVAIIATAEGVFTDSDENYLNRLRSTYIDPQNVRSPASTVNADVNVRFFVFRDEGNLNAVTFKSQEPPLIIPVPPRHHPICGSALGVYIRHIDLFFCRITSFKIEVVMNQSNEPRYIRVILFFKHNDNLPLVLGIPIGKLPSMAPRSEQELAVWGSYYGVGTRPPFDFEKLLIAEQTRTMTIDFLWLHHLLAFGLTEKPSGTILRVPWGEDMLITTYGTRPLMLSEEYMVRIQEFIEQIQDSKEESVGSNSPSWSDDSDDEFTFP